MCVCVCMYEMHASMSYIVSANIMAEVEKPRDLLPCWWEIAGNADQRPENLRAQGADSNVTLRPWTPGLKAPFLPGCSIQVLVDCKVLTPIWGKLLCGALPTWFFPDRLHRQAWSHCFTGYPHCWLSQTDARNELSRELFWLHSKLQACGSAQDSIPQRVRLSRTSMKLETPWFGIYQIFLGQFHLFCCPQNQ